MKNRLDTQSLGASLVLMGAGILIGDPQGTIDGRLVDAIESMFNVKLRPEEPPKYVNIRELAYELGMKEHTLLKIKKAGKLDPALKRVGSKIYYDREQALKLASEEIGKNF